MRSCDNGYLRLGIFNMFVDAATEGRIQLDLQSVYHQLVDHFMYRKPYDLCRRPCFHVAALEDSTCRITPLGCTRYTGLYLVKTWKMEVRGSELWVKQNTKILLGHHQVHTIN